MHNQRDDRDDDDDLRDSDEPGSSAEPPPSTDYFAFYQDDARWLWRRVSDAGCVVASSTGSFDYYLQCIADARKHGWKGKPVGLCVRPGARFDEMPSRDGSS